MAQVPLRMLQAGVRRLSSCELACGLPFAQEMIRVWAITLRHDLCARFEMHGALLLTC